MTRVALNRLFVASALCLAFVTTGVAQGKIHPPDKIKATRTVRGTFVGFEMGDYLHAEIRKANGKRVSFFMGEPESLRYFLALNKGKQLMLTYQIVDSYIPEADGMNTIERLVSARIGSETDTQWWRRIRRSGNSEKLRARYEELIERATKSN